MTTHHIIVKAAAVTPPLQNTPYTKNVYVVQVSPTAQSVDLTTIFAALTETNNDGEFLTLQADGCKAYIAFAPHGQTGIDPRATGNGSSVCWALPDGVSMPVVPGSGEENATSPTGWATTFNYSRLHYAVATGAPTGYLRMYLSSKNPSHKLGSRPFPAP